MRVGSRIPRLLLPLFLIVLPEQHVEAMQSLAECGNKLEGRLPKECGAAAYSYSPLCSTDGTTSACCSSNATTSNGSNAAPATLNELIERTEAIVSSIVAAAMPEVSNLCEYREGCSCSLKAVSNNLGDMVCVDGLGDADSCARDGRMLNLEESAVRIAPETPTPYSETYNGMICATQGLDTTFKAKFETDGDWLAWQYFGSDQGMFRSYPGGPRAEDDYDPRRRPWYTIAANGPKDVVLVVDTSGSMGENNRLGLTKDALKALIDSLAPTDRLGLVEFDASAQIFTPGTSSGFLEMTSAGKQQASAAIDGLRASGSTNFRAGLQTALEYFKRARDGGTSTYCESVIVFITDGRDTAIEDGQITKREMIEEVRGYYDALGTDYPQPNLFTLSMGDDADNAMPAMFACAFDGVWASVSDGQDPLSQLASFFAFFALSLTNEDRVVWADLYEDASGAGLVTTASQAVFREAGGALMGVVGVDVMLGSLKDVATQEQIESAIQARSQQCMGKLDDVECELQLVRSQSATPSECPAPADSGGGCVNVHDDLVFWAPPLSEKKTRDDADNDCKSKGYYGLAVLANFDELAAVASLASPDGSWVALNDRGVEGSFHSYHIDGCSDPAHNCYCTAEKRAIGWCGVGTIEGSCWTADSEAACTGASDIWIGASSGHRSHSHVEGCDLRHIQNFGADTRCEKLWGFGEPNNYGDGEDCVFVDPRGTYNNLNDQGCEKLHHYVCGGPTCDGGAVGDGGAVNSENIGGAVGGAAALGLLLIVVAVCCCCCCKKKKQAAPPAAAAPPTVAQGSAVEAVPMGQPVAYPDVHAI